MLSALTIVRQHHQIATGLDQETHHVCHHASQSRCIDVFPALNFSWSMILSENRLPLFGIMLRASLSPHMSATIVTHMARFWLRDRCGIGAAMQHFAARDL
jgi:hypothetical protein